MAGDTRVTENAALADMRTIWVRLHSFYARKIDSLGKITATTYPFLSIAPNAPDRNTIIFEEARKVNNAIYQHIIYTEFLPRIAAIPSYKGYKPSVREEVSNKFTTAVFRFGHTLIRNNFLFLNNYFTRADQPLTLRASFENNTENFQFGINRIMFGLIGSESEEFDNVFLTSIGERLFISPQTPGFQNLATFNIQRGCDHGLASYPK